MTGGLRPARAPQERPSSRWSGSGAHFLVFTEPAGLAVFQGPVRRRRTGGRWPGGVTFWSLPLEVARWS